LGRRALQRGESPERMIAEGSKWLRRAQESSPDRPQHDLEARLALLEACGRMARGVSPEAALARAQSALERTLEVNPNDRDSHAASAEVQWRLAQWRKGREAAEAVARGLASAERALGLNPRHARALLVQGALYLEQARLEPAARGALRNKAKDSVDRALATNQYLQREYAPWLARARASL